MANDSNSRPVAQHVFVDFENMKTLDLGSIGGRPIDFEVFFGPQDKKLDLNLVAQLMEHSDAVKLVRSPKSGKNALDFVLAFHLGQSALKDPRGYFHLISKDTGFDALVDLLKSRGVSIKRHASWSALTAALSLKQSSPNPKAAKKAVVKKETVKVVEKISSAVPQNPKPLTLAEISGKVTRLLTNSPLNRPGTRDKLEAVIIQHLTPAVCSGREKSIIEELLKSQVVNFDEEEKAIYNLPASTPNPAPGSGT